MVWWLRFCISIGGSRGPILGWGAKFPHAATKIGVAKKKERKIVAGNRGTFKAEAGN